MTIDQFLDKQILSIEGNTILLRSLQLSHDKQISKLNLMDVLHSKPEKEDCLIVANTDDSLQEEDSSCDSNASLELAEITETGVACEKIKIFNFTQKKKEKELPNKYMECTPEIDKILNKKSTRSH